ncbi:MAG: tetratricopeptide repeat protein [Planctomycetes bacterium]|nr:tetratricopeptide repeat protein [Planctomycetota bacterium]
MTPRQKERGGKHHPDRAPTAAARISRRRLAVRFVQGALIAAALVAGAHAWRWLEASGDGGTPGAKRGPRAADLAPHLDAGMRHMTSERYPDALLEFLKAARLAPDDPRPHYRLGKVYERLQFDRRAEAEYRLALQLEPDYRDAKLGLARVLCDFGKNAEATALLRELERAAPDDPLIWAELAINALRLDRPAEAVELLERYVRSGGAIELDWGLTHLGRAYAETGQIEKAESAYRRALSINPSMQLAHLWLGHLLIARGEREAADRQMRTFREIRDLSTEAHRIQNHLLRNPPDAPSLVRLAEIRNLLRQPDLAIQAVNGALDVDPRCAAALVQLAHSLTLLGKPADAVRHLRRAVELEPANERLRELYEKRRRALESAGGR